MDAASILGFIAGYLTVAATVFLLYLPGLILFVVLLLVVGILQLVAWPFLILIRGLRGRRTLDTQNDGLRLIR
jgi:phage-related minor tail protein